MTVASQQESTDLLPGAVEVVQWKSTTYSWCQCWSTQPKSVGNRWSSWSAESVGVGERKGILPLNFATNIQMAVLPKVRTALCAASQLPGEGPTDVEDAPVPVC